MSLRLSVAIFHARFDSLTAEMNNEKPNHADSSPAGGRLLIELANIHGQDDSNDEMAGAHP